jgi:hypothetical protein
VNLAADAKEGEAVDAGLDVDEIILWISEDVGSLDSISIAEHVVIDGVSQLGGKAEQW